MSKDYNLNVIKVLRMTREMIILADEGDRGRTDPSCGVLYGVLRDTAYKLKNLAEEEKLLHRTNGIWDIEEVAN